ncbi:sigma-70 family RNA polymerase sigma factor [Aquimarina sp. AD1]|uniref:RNA polymerase sigma factor n=1 Tax=Aquimarina sp. (strain AD1) TaxID=1714848 RepID=UPI000E556324|nr:sigma-70 family RNA polymerase sigma factor [Aquimarina sp. AD1]AXT58011.1 sigma-70 family RNA polymerase sigma factor [Aquimarina sp. AD1]RKN05616.1 sigma-70 family RNA polymerase sigma factor [Aquimarina sp. AD1]
MNSTKNQYIVEGIITGNNDVLKSFYKKNLPAVRKIILKYQGTTEDVEDVFQEAMILVYHKLRTGDLELHQSIHAYFIGVCKNIWKNQSRKKRMLEYSEPIVQKAEDNDVSLYDKITNRDQEEVFYRHITKLTDSSRLVLGLFFEGKSMRDIANSTGYTEGYTRKKKCMIKDRLFQMVQNDPIYAELTV